MKKKAMCLFAHYDKENKYTEDDISYISHLSSIFEEVVVLTGNSGKIENDTLQNVKYVLNIPNRGVDFGKVDYYLQKNNVDKYEQFYIVNNSCILVRDLAPSIEYMETKELDYWGYTTSNELGLHIQSYFYYLNKKGLGVLKEMLSENKPFDNDLSYVEVIRQIEIKMLSYFSSKGLKCGSYIHCHKIKTSKEPNILYYYPDWLLLNPNFPFIKKRPLALGVHSREYLESCL